MTTALITQDDIKGLKIAVVGRGNVGSHLFKAFRHSGLQVSLVDSRSLSGIEDDFDMILISVSDSSIGEVAGKTSALLPDFEGIVVHTAGSVEMRVLAPFFKNYGVFYPLQTFSQSIPIDNYREIPVFIEGSDPRALNLLLQLGKTTFADVYALNSAVREKLHLASVFACNFTNAMYCMAANILHREGLPFEIVHALISQTAWKANHFPPEDCQTGPARRNDRTVMEKHLSLLQTTGTMKEIYSLISDYIFKKYNELD